MNKNYLYSKIFVLLIFFCLIATSAIFANDENQVNNDKKINEMTEKITNKILLSDVQKNTVKSILIDYFSNLQKLAGDESKLTDLRNSSEAKIVNILDSKQKMKFEIIKTEWWNLTSQ